ncbi:MAG: Biotin carboxylase of acetyl-CoA carboxylase [Brockia lithotrophica]|uniref:Biotin carboxylase n=1 Tax=Brockia lithotrophica TaxID=933949 RepID=A0A2T5G688_9BACL|nr:MAG: Biotin carboxylase of acetyl-CoA carboxylase [Brockia lithotrophica]
MFSTLLVANRGEVAVRIVRAAKELGIRTIAVYSEADRGALHTRLADKAYCIGPAPAQESYLNVTNLLSLATLLGVDAIHPGYGFLAENARFAELVEEVGITFVGPPAEVIARMGDKSAARRTMRSLGIPVLPGTEVLHDVEEALREAEAIGYPVLVKATAGGGGRGMRVARTPEELRAAFRTAQLEAERAYGNGGLYLERYVERSRHIEVQILADRYGNVVHLGERECSLQRRHQKLLEEAPSLPLTPAMREELGERVVRAVRGIGYVGAGTLEFLYDVRTGELFFIEMNTRLQVEHPVTELVTGIDIVRETIRLAAGEPLGIRQEDVVLRGWSIECRINAEDPERGFLPTPGRLERVHLPGGFGVRVDTYAEPGAVVPPHYDSLVAKLVVWGETRDEAIRRMRRALDELVLEGENLRTTIPLCRQIVEDPRFVRGEVHTGFLEELLAPRRAGVAGS